MFSLPVLALTLIAATAKVQAVSTCETIFSACETTYPIPVLAVPGEITVASVVPLAENNWSIEAEIVVTPTDEDVLAAAELNVPYDQALDIVPGVASTGNWTTYKIDIVVAETNANIVAQGELLCMDISFVYTYSTPAAVVTYLAACSENAVSQLLCWNPALCPYEVETTTTTEEETTTTTEEETTTTTEEETTTTEEETTTTTEGETTTATEEETTTTEEETTATEEETTATEEHETTGTNEETITTAEPTTTEECTNGECIVVPTSTTSTCIYTSTCMTVSSTVIVTVPCTIIVNCESTTLVISSTTVCFPPAVATPTSTVVEICSELATIACPTITSTVEPTAESTVVPTAAPTSHPKPEYTGAASKDASTFSKYIVAVAALTFSMVLL